MIEYAGAVDVEPPYGAHDDGVMLAWTLSPDGSEMRPHAEAGLDLVIEGLRDIVRDGRGRRRFAGIIAAYDDTTGALVVVTIGSGRVTRRTVRTGRLRTRSNVIDLAGRRRAISRRIG